ncbi:NAD(P)/FAD-dependent oxidoreductase [Spartinivicinus poritis]|uniref:FAD-dependent oxidoreductase n=1 Tax=Spartinivicinus poritis TaxID=2994640 RepID=A0ABT5UHC7_9GAMM|nr:FAD-dependent oxidoreductase [Spartinivicinus sp. A2-2]MDE1465784.1 FAD-dependent oxidoreductase [Spartinivicinus sp. A2-2]
MEKIAVIGAGVAGLTLAHHLKDIAEVTLFEKSRGVSGRLATRYSGDYVFDHGAPFFTVRNKAFRNFIQDAIDKGLLVEWQPKVITLENISRHYRRDWFEPHYVGFAKMNSWCKALAKNHKIQLNTKISSVQKVTTQWQLIDTNGNATELFDWVISTAPAPQTQELLTLAFSRYYAFQQVEMMPCFCLMVGFEQPVDLPWDLAKVKNSAIQWISLENSKPGRDHHVTCIVIQSTEEWANEYLEHDLGWVSDQLLTEFVNLVGLPIPENAHIDIHRWRYAGVNLKNDTNNPVQTKDPFLLDPDQRLAACGDWCLNGDVESAFLSAYELARDFHRYLS